MKMLTRTGTMLAVTMLTAILPAYVHAEKADRDKPLFFEAEEAERLQSTKDMETRVLQGNVVITQGTLHITAHKLILKQDQAGARFGEAWGSATKQATFKQKREGKEDFVEAFADRVEYDEKSGIVQLFSKVHIKTGQDEFTSEYIRYNLNNDEFKLDGSMPGSKAGSATDAPKRVKGVIYPQNRTANDKKGSR